MLLRQPRSPELAKCVVIKKWTKSIALSLVHAHGVVMAMQLSVCGEVCSWLKVASVHFPVENISGCPPLWTTAYDVYVQWM